MCGGLQQEIQMDMGTGKSQYIPHILFIHTFITSGVMGTTEARVSVSVVLLVICTMLYHVVCTYICRNKYRICQHSVVRY